MEAQEGSVRDMPPMVTLNRSVQGFSHVRQGKVCQDSSAAFGDPEGGWHVAVVSDGHGDSSCMRSDRGSKFAVEVASECLSLFADAASTERDWGGTPLEDLLVPTREANTVRRITDALVSRWRIAVLDDLAKEPLTEEEIAQASLKMRQLYTQGERLEHAYGATLVCALWLPQALLLIQQGDGACVVMLKDGTAIQPIPADPRCLANVTTSLCDEDVADAVRHAVVRLDQSPAVACLLTSDGVENSVASEMGIVAFCKQLLVDLTQKGIDGLDDSLPQRLQTLSAEGNGDDVSLALVANAEAAGLLTDEFEHDLAEWQAELRVAMLREKLVSTERKHAILAEEAAKATASRECLESAVTQDEQRLQDIANEIASLEERLWALGKARLSFRTASIISRTNRDLGNLRATAASLSEKLNRERECLASVDESAIDEFEEFDKMRRALEDELEQLDGMSGTDMTTDASARP